MHERSEPPGVAPPDQLVSGEGVAYDLTHAGVGSRTVAAVIDLLIQFGGLMLFVVIDTRIVGATDAAAITAVILVEVILVFAGYPIVSEWLTRGRTVGKVCMGLRVVRDDGGPVGFRQALVRGLAGLVLEKPGLFAPVTATIGFATMMVSSAEKRLGDMMAGTFVLNERAGGRHAGGVHDFFVPYELAPWTSSLDLSRLDDKLALGVRQFVVRARGMTPAAQNALGEQLRAAVLAVIAPPPPPWAPTPAVLVSILAERRRRNEALLARPAYAAGWSPGWGRPLTPAPRWPDPALGAVSGPPAPPSTAAPSAATARPAESPFAPPG